MEILFKILQGVTALSLLVIIHELGHFLFAKLFKCRVEKFYLFFNPWFSIFKFKKGETEYGLGWLPLGGYVKIAGMIDESMDTAAMKEPPKPWEFRSKPAWQRLLIMIGGVVMNVVLAFFIYVGMSMYWGDSYYATADVNAANGFEFSDFGREIGFENGDKILSVDGQPVENSGEIGLKLLLDGVKTVEIERGGRRMEIPMHEQYIAGMLESEEPLLRPFVPLIVDSLMAGGARQAGMRIGDRVLALNGLPVTYNTRRTEDFTGQTVELEVSRDSAGIQQTLRLPVEVSAEGMIGIGVRAIELPVSRRTYDFFEAIPQGFRRAKTEIANYFKQLKIIFSPDTGAHKQVGGIIAIGNIFPGAWNWYSFWSITAMLSIMLAVLNILPIPGLDGGHVMFVLYEMIARRKPSDKFMEYAQWTGLILLLALMLYANGNDVFKLFK